MYIALFQMTSKICFLVKNGLYRNCGKCYFDLIWMP